MVSRSVSSPRVAIVGGGAIGLASAWALARAGAHVTVLEAGVMAGQGALAASGGMLAQGFESANEDAGRAFVALSARSLSLWDDWADRLSHLVEAPLGYRRNGSLVPIAGDSQGRWLDDLQVRSERYGIAHERLTGDEARRVQPGLSGDVAAALRFPGDGEIDNRALGGALVAAIRAEGAEIRANWPVELIETGPGSMTVSGPAGVFEADRVILAAGWQSVSLARHVPEAGKLIPVKGQMLSVEPCADLTGCIRAHDCYLSAKPDRIVIGASVSNGAADDEIDPKVTSLLTDAARRLFPPLESARLLDVWTGVRPGTSDGLPILGASACEGVVLGLGAFRNGVLLAPAMAEIIRDVVLGQGEPDAAFAPQRALTALTPD